MSNFMKYLIGGMAGLAFLPTLAVPLIACYAGNKAGEKIGNSIYKMNVRSNAKHALNINTEKVDGLENIYLNANEFEKYFGRKSSEETAYVNNEARNIIKRENREEPVLTMILLLQSKDCGTKRENIIDIIENNSRLKNKRLILNNIDSILNEYGRKNFVRKEGEEYKINFSDRKYLQTPYVFENNIIKFLGMTDKSYSPQGGNITIQKPVTVDINRYNNAKKQEKHIGFLNKFVPTTGRNVIVGNGIQNITSLDNMNSITIPASWERKRWNEVEA